MCVWCMCDLWVWCVFCFFNLYVRTPVHACVWYVVCVCVYVLFCVCVCVWCIYVSVCVSVYLCVASTEAVPVS